MGCTTHHLVVVSSSTLENVFKMSRNAMKYGRDVKAFPVNDKTCNVPCRAVCTRT